MTWVLNQQDRDDDDTPADEQKDSSPEVADAAVSGPSASPSEEPPPLSAVAILLMLGECRELFVVGRALAEKYPTAESFEDVRNDPAFQDSAERLARLVNVIRARSQNHAGVWDLARLQATGAEQYSDALAAVDAFAADLGVDTDDLLSVMSHA